MKGTERGIEWRKIVEFVVAFALLPTVIFYYAAQWWGEGVLWYSYHAVISLFVIQAALSYV